MKVHPDQEEKAPETTPIVKADAPEADAPQANASEAQAAEDPIKKLKALLHQKAEVDVSSTDEHGNTPLHLAAAKIDLAAIEKLLPHVTDVNSENRQGKTALSLLHIAIRDLQNFNHESMEGKNAHTITALLGEMGAKLSSKEDVRKDLLVHKMLFESLKETPAYLYFKKSKESKYTDEDSYYMKERARDIARQLKRK